jgi:hypothetical protein
MEAEARAGSQVALAGGRVGDRARRDAGDRCVSDDAAVPNQPRELDRVADPSARAVEVADTELRRRREQRFGVPREAVLEAAGDFGLGAVAHHAHRIGWQHRIVEKGHTGALSELGHAGLDEDAQEIEGGHDHHGLRARSPRRTGRANIHPARIG